MSLQKSINITSKDFNNIEKVFYNYIIRIYPYLVYKFSKIYIKKNKKIVILVTENNAAKAQIYCIIRKNTKGAGKK